MKIEVKDNQGVVLYARTLSHDDTRGPVMSFLMGADEGGDYNTVLGTKNNEFVFKTKAFDTATLVRLVEGIVVRAPAKPKVEAAKTATASTAAKA